MSVLDIVAMWEEEPFLSVFKSNKEEGVTESPIPFLTRVLSRDHTQEHEDKVNTSYVLRLSAPSSVA